MALPTLSAAALSLLHTWHPLRVMWPAYCESLLHQPPEASTIDEGKVIGLLQGTGGVADLAQTLLDTLPVRSTGAVVIADPDPEQLVDRCIARLCEQHGEQAVPNAGHDAAMRRTSV